MVYSFTLPATVFQVVPSLICHSWMAVPGVSVAVSLTVEPFAAVPFYSPSAVKVTTSSAATRLPLSFFTAL